MGSGQEGLVFSKLLIVAVRSSLFYLDMDFSSSLNLMPFDYVASYHSSCLSFTGTETSIVEAPPKWGSGS